MILSKELPPKDIYDKAVKLFGANFNKGTTFTIGETIHCKDGMTEDLLVHEKVHIKQQGKRYRKWWDKYFNDKEFRLQEELEAYREQYKWVKENIKNRNQQSKYLLFFAESLSGKMYGNLIDKQEALRIIKL
jgi:aminoglycoside N3'-acetyltransferase